MSREQHTCYDVITVCLDDFDAEADWIGDEARSEYEQRAGLARTLSDDEWRVLADRVSDELYDGDAFHSAKNRAFDHVIKLRAAKPDSEVAA